MSSHIVDKNAWSKMDMFNQMGNIGSEVGRALSAKNQNKNGDMQAAFARGLDLIDLTASLWAHEKSPRLRELLVAREQFARSVTTDDVDETLELYFMQFAIAARLNR